MEKALFAAGCFWGVEEYFRKIPGVEDTKVGYSGGITKNPTYETVCNDNTQHAEVLKIDFDEKTISYEELLNYFWECHDPTTLDRQGYDVGNQYRSAIFYFNDSQKQIAEKSKIKRQLEIDKDIVTEILKVEKFYLAESYHQCYIQKKNQ
tara:strand:- start:518 stop:967 length:450 start_codon:yes stop_codon:yes gene_type:complete